LDISTSRIPRLVNTFRAEFAYTTSDIFIAGDLLFLAPELEIVDISDPLDPFRVPTAEIPFRGTISDVVGATAFMTGDGLALVDISECGSYLGYKTWVEIAANLAGEGGTRWHTDVVARNTSAQPAAFELTLHHQQGTSTVSTSIDAGAQGVFERVVEMIMGDEAKGALEINSNRQLQVSARIYSSSSEGSFGQFLAGHPEGSGLRSFEEAWLLQLRQEEGRFRSNISVTYGGDQEAIVEVTLYGTSGIELHSYELHLDPGQVVQDLQPFRNRAGQPNIGWGFAKVKVIRGHDVFCSASVIDTQTKDATTIPMAREP
jgi:hypothetical protein